MVLKASPSSNAHCLVIPSYGGGGGVHRGDVRHRFHDDDVAGGREAEEMRTLGSVPWTVLNLNPKP
jgi:hypothetical protein